MVIKNISIRINEELLEKLRIVAKYEETYGKINVEIETPQE